LERTRSLLDAAIPDCLVTGYATVIDSLALPDPDDRHVLAAAICAGTPLILTFNLADFPPEKLAESGVEAKHPDELFAQLLFDAPDEFCAAVKLQRQALKNPPMTVQQFLSGLENAGLPQTVALLRYRLNQL
jgi:hypothetical protein